MSRRISSRSLTLMLMASFSMVARDASSARWYAFTITVGCMLRDRKGSATTSISPARMITLVVPSPTSSSCDRESSSMLLAAGWATSISRRMALPSLVMTMPPMGSSSIFNMDLGPSVLRTISATACGEHAKEGGAAAVSGGLTFNADNRASRNAPWRPQCLLAGLSCPSRAVC